MTTSEKSALKNRPMMGGDDVVYQRVDDRGEGRANDHTDCHVEHIAAHGEGFELFKEILDAAGFLF